MVNVGGSSSDVFPPFLGSFGVVDPGTGEELKTEIFGGTIKTLETETPGGTKGSKNEGPIGGINI
jgi:hypothetical protein